MTPVQRLYRLACVVGVTALLIAPAGARQGQPPLGRSPSVAPLDGVDTLSLPAIDVSSLLAEDSIRGAATGRDRGRARFASPHDLELGTAARGTWQTLADGARVWRLRVHAPNATDLSFGFHRYALPAGATLHIWSEADGYYQGPYTAADNRPHGELWTPVIPGERAVIELWVPSDAKFTPELELGRVGRGYRDWFNRAGKRETRHQIFSGPCNNDVVCPEGQPWRRQIRAVGVYQLDATWTCTGTMLNNTADDCRPLFITADHCGISNGNDQTMVVYWNFESPTCGDQCCGPLDQNQTGATLLATDNGPDFALVELDQVPDPSYAVYYAGWDRSGVAAGGSVGIHHPNTDEKAISFNLDPLVDSNNCGAATHWDVDNWEDGTTEAGSSGSALFDPASKLLVGTLTGGGAACGNNDYDCYGKFSVSWTSGASPHLDPGGSGIQTLSGKECSGAAIPLYDTHLGVDSCAADPTHDDGLWEPGEEVTVAVSLDAINTLTGVTGTLRSTTPGITILDAAATWPDLVSGTPELSDAPHFRLLLDETVPCASTIDLEVEVSGNEGGPFFLRFSHPVGEQLLGARGPIPDAGVPLVSPLDVASDVTLTDVDVRISIQHSYVGDISVSVRSPTGTVVQLIDRPGEPVSQFGCRDDNAEVTFDDASGLDLENHCDGTDPWYDGVGAPLETLAAFVGERSAGRWELIVQDYEPNDNGALIEWELLTTPPITSCKLCEASDCSGVEIAVNTLFATGGPAGDVTLHLPGPTSACATGVQVRMSPSARPTVDPGTFPSDPAFADVSTDDLDGGPNFTHTPPAGNLWFYLAVEDLPGGLPGPSGRYDY